MSSEKEIHNGADDNASGVAIILDLASKLIGMDSSNNYLFIAFGAEELGLLGSNYFNKYPTVDLESINYMFNFDMVGRLNDQNNLAIYGTGTSPIFKQTILSNNKDFKILTRMLTIAGCNMASNGSSISSKYWLASSFS